MAEEREYFIKVGSDFKKVTKEVKETGKEVQKATGDVSTFSDGLDQATGGAITKFRGLITTIKGAAKGFRGLKVAIASTGIGALANMTANLIGKDDCGCGKRRDKLNEMFPYKNK